MALNKKERAVKSCGGVCLSTAAGLLCLLSCCFCILSIVLKDGTPAENAYNSAKDYKNRAKRNFQEACSGVRTPDVILPITHTASIILQSSNQVAAPAPEEEKPVIAKEGGESEDWALVDFKDSDFYGI